MKKKKWNRVLPGFLVMVTVISLLSGCGGKSAEKEDAETITVYLWSTSLYEKYAPYVQEQLPDINVEFVVGNNNLDFYKFLKENGGLPDIITCCRFSLHDASPLKDSLMDLSTTNAAGAVYDSYLSNFMNEDGRDLLLGCVPPLTAGDQKETFRTLIEETLGDDCDYDTVKNIHENLNEMIEQNSENPEPLALDKAEVKYLLAKSGVEEEKLETFDEQYDSAAGEHSTLLASNIANLKKFEIKTPDITIQVNPECADLVETRIIDGQKCLVIVVDDRVEINGISAKTAVSGGLPKSSTPDASDESKSDTSENEIDVPF